jgi:predicted SnoaL-like aldol condensation-catalyzing enzyme
MSICARSLMGAAMLLWGSQCAAQVPVVPAPDPDALFHSADSTLNANKQVVYHVLKDLLEAGHAELAPKYMTERYIQHNPNIPSGRGGDVKIFAAMGPPRPIAARIHGKIVAVVAEGDLVVVATAHTLADPSHPGKTYTTTGFDMWRIRNGRSDEHWDDALLGMKGPGEVDAPTAH